MRKIVFPVVGLGLIMACSSPSGFGSSGGTGGTKDGGLEFPDSGNSSGGPVSTPIGKLRGNVLVPSGDLPMPGALVYLTAVEPDAIPSGNYCDKCVDITAATATARSAVDGSFELDVFAAAPQYLVVQKGSFRRVRKFTPKAGDNTAPADLTTMPGVDDRSNGDTVPRMLVVDAGSVDPITEALDRLGINVPSVDVKDPADAEPVLRNAAQLAKYQVVFLPCSAFDVKCDQDQALNSTIKNNLRKFVQDGGKLYSADFSYEFVNQIWPGYVKWASYGSNWTSTPNVGTACGSKYDAKPVWNDTGLSNWMTQIGNSNVSLGGNWSKMDGVKTANGRDIDGNPAQITPKIWVSANRDGSKYPATISFPDTCGRVMFSTFHAEGGADHLAQEQALLYVLLEVNTCAGGEIDR